jgi:hypothetical protein
VAYALRFVRARETSLVSVTKLGRPLSQCGSRPRNVVTGVPRASIDAVRRCRQHPHIIRKVDVFNIVSRKNIEIVARMKADMVAQT